MQTVADFIANRPGDEQEILSRLRALIFQVAPYINETLSNGVPYFSYHRRVFFLSPASAVACVEGVGPALLVPKVTIGFCHGHLFSTCHRLLANVGSKEVWRLPISSLPEIQVDILSELLNEAMLIDATFPKKLHPKKQ